MEEDKKNTTQTKHTKDVSVEENGNDKTEKTTETYSADSSSKKSTEHVEVQAKTESKYYNEVEDGENSKLQGNIQTENKSFWGKIKSRIVDTFSHTDINPGLLQRSRGYDGKYSFGETGIEVERKGGKKQSALNYNYGPDYNMLTASDDRYRADKTIKKIDGLGISPQRTNVTSVQFDKDGNQRKSIHITPTSAIESKTKADGSGKGKSVNLVNGEISGKKVKYQGETITEDKPMNPRKARNFFDRMQTLGDSTVASIMEAIPQLGNVVAKAQELDLRETQLNEKRAKLEKFKQAKGLSELSTEVRDCSENPQVMPLGDYFEKNESIDKLSQEAKTAKAVRRAQSQYE